MQKDTMARLSKTLAIDQETEIIMENLITLIPRGNKETRDTSKTKGITVKMVKTRAATTKATGNANNIRRDQIPLNFANTLNISKLLTK